METYSSYINGIRSNESCVNKKCATFYRAKNAEFSAENALFDINLMATQSGTVVNTSGASNTFTVPCFETIDIVANTTEYTLKHTPAEAPSTIYKLNGDGTLGTSYTKSTTAGATAFAVSGATITVPTGLTAGDQVYVIYEYTANGTSGNTAVEVANSATNFPVGCKFIMEVLGCDVCDQTNMIFAYLIFPNAKLSPDFDWNIATDSTHPFSLRAMQDYCDKDKLLYRIVIPEID